MTVPNPMLRADRSLAEAADGLAVTALSALITVGVIDKAGADELLDLWRQRGHQPPADDQGLAEAFLERQRQARRQETRSHLRLVASAAVAQEPAR